MRKKEAKVETWGVDPNFNLTRNPGYRSDNQKDQGNDETAPPLLPEQESAEREEGQSMQNAPQDLSGNDHQLDRWTL